MTRCGTRLSLAAVVLWSILLAAGCASIDGQHRDLSATGFEGAQRAELTEVAFYPQKALHCGPAALATLMDWADTEADPDELAAQIYLSGRRGTLQAELLAAARHQGLLAYVHSPSLASLLRQIDAGQPVLVLQNLAFDRLPLWHYAVVVGYDLDAETVLLRSGTTKRRIMSLRHFERSWRRGDYWALTLHAPDNLPAHADATRFLSAAADLEAIGQFDAADRAYQAASETWPTNPGSWLGRGNIHYRKGQYRAAAEFYRQGLEHDSSEPALHHNLAWAYLRLGDHALARPHAERAQRLDPTDDGRYGGALEHLMSRE